MRLSVRVTPGARHDQISGRLDDGTLKIRLRARAVDGQANRALLAFLAAHLNVPKSAVHLLRGQSARTKIIEITALFDPSLLEGDD